MRAREVSVLPSSAVTPSVNDVNRRGKYICVRVSKCEKTYTYAHMSIHTQTHTRLHTSSVSFAHPYNINVRSIGIREKAFLIHLKKPPFNTVGWLVVYSAEGYPFKGLTAR